ncbi:M23 family metallopeptidase [Jeotgalibacillus sp. R-1-5s-1]|uniref:M23 family metallopeptidase n=1 Tax=Jeotgalibacillus sp. R-1-5s-1 TaxID=2555897 RepID=UPI001069C094|nr:M23 family metallopeptidase [Jeotgalibacillus sp. R-1-5s-1]TFD97102.1 M23 family metallopeptidase [Jeotgalibacillus sp. R-1-5s-1]
MKKFLITILFLSGLSFAWGMEAEASEFRIFVPWGEATLVEGQIGRVTLQQDLPLLKLQDGKMTSSDIIRKKDQSFRVYNFTYLEEDLYLGVGGGYYFLKDAKVSYVTPAKNKLETLATIVSYKDSTFPLPQGTYEKMIPTYYNTFPEEDKEFKFFKNHAGIEIPVPENTKVFAAADGIVRTKGWDDIQGWYYDIDTGEFVFRYGHLGRFAGTFEVGSIVTQGDLIGYTGSTGDMKIPTTSISKPHFHFNIMTQNGYPIDSYIYLRSWEQNF